MTPDESAWREAQLAALEGSSTVDGCAAADVAKWAADAADASLAELRKRRVAGAFGPAKSPHAYCSGLGCPICPPAPSKMDAGEPNVGAISEYWARRAGVAERERDEQRARAEEAVARCAELRDAQLAVLARAEAAEAILREADALMGGGHRELTRDAFCASISAILRSGSEAAEARRAVESLLRKALGALQLANKYATYAPEAETPERVRTALAKAKAAGYGVEP